MHVQLCLGYACSAVSGLCTECLDGKEAPFPGFHDHDKPLREKVEKGRICFRSAFQKTERLVGWLLCCEAMVKQSIMGGRHVRQNCLLPDGQDAERSNRKGLYPSNVHSQGPVSNNQASASTACPCLHLELSYLCFPQSAEK